MFAGGARIAFYFKLTAICVEIVLITFSSVLLCKLKTGRLKRPKIVFVFILISKLLNVLSLGPTIISPRLWLIITAIAIQIILLVVYPYMIYTVMKIKKTAQAEFDAGASLEFYSLLGDPQTSVVPIAIELEGPSHRYHDQTEITPA